MTLQFNHINRDIERAVESVHIDGVFELSGLLNLEKM